MGLFSRYRIDRVSDSYPPKTGIPAEGSTLYWSPGAAQRSMVAYQHMAAGTNIHFYVTGPITMRSRIRRWWKGDARDVWGPTRST